MVGVAARAREPSHRRIATATGFCTVESLILKSVIFANSSFSRSSNELARLAHPVHLLQPARTTLKTEKVMDETVSEKHNMFNRFVSVLADYSIRVACENN